MLTPDERKTVAGFTRILQIIIFAMVMGGSTFLVVVLVMPAPARLNDTLIWPGVGFGVLQMVLAVVVPQIILRQQRQAEIKNQSLVRGHSPTSEVASLLSGLQVRRIIAGALLEGAAFFNLVAYMQGRHTVSLVMAAALIAGLVTLFPLRSLVEQWVENELRTVRELRQLEGA
jgi:hypothetical protein